jgi:uncharacterized RDD family membrane protein YckC
MANYDPPQPQWKRVVAGILDFLVVFLLLGFILAKIFPGGPGAPHPVPSATTVEFFSLNWQGAALLVVLIVAYFVILGRTGGTVFQRLFGMKRAAK